ncbi:hypothetical protein LX32DRAFT_499014, partial [Colletotrichum zoysiae]
SGRQCTYSLSRPAGRPRLITTERSRDHRSPSSNAPGTTRSSEDGSTSNDHPISTMLAMQE